MKRKSFFRALIFFLLVNAGLSVYGETLSSENAGWTAVLSGKAVCPPCQTSYGFAVLSDAKMISACTENGKVLWERKVPGHPDPFLTVFSSDFLLSVCGKNELSLINPSGLTLWSVKVPFEIKNEPQAGLDSRIFVKGEKNIACYSITGICKWNLETEPLRSENLMQMNDGSLIALCLAEESGKTTAIRISPFGEMLETITFSGKILSATAFSSGLLLYFSDGSAGMCFIKENKASTKWTIPHSDRAFSNTTPSYPAQFTQLNALKGALAANCTRGTRVIIFNTFDGRVSDFFDIPQKFEETILFKSTGNGQNVFLSGKQRAFLYTLQGTELWKGDFPGSGDIFSKWNQIILTENTTLVLCSTNWAMAGFKISQNISRKTVPQKIQKKTYEPFLISDSSSLAFLEYSETLPERMTGTDRINILKSGNYGAKEKEFLSGLKDFCCAYREFQMQKASRPSLVQKSIFERDYTGVENAIMQLPEFGTDFFVQDLASIIRNESNQALLTAALRAVSECAFDPDSRILKNIEIRAKSLPASSDSAFIAICDAVLEICRFMGRPALFSYGMDIITVFLNPQYSSGVRDYARQTLSKIARLKI